MTLADLYNRGWSIERIAREANLGLSIGSIRRRLIQAGIKLRHPAARGIRCVDCEKKIERGRRCKLHRKIRHAQLNREFNRTKFGYKARIEC